MSPSLPTVATLEPGDLLGSAMHEFAARGLAPLFLHTEHGHRFRLDLGPYFTSPSALDPDERTFLAMARGTVLDVGCGPARHARYLQQRGLRALGLDRSPGALTVACALGLRHAVHADAMTAALPRGIGTALLLDGNLGLAGSIYGTRRLLGRLARACVPSGRLLVGGRAPAGVTARRLVLRVEYRGTAGPWFTWLQLNLAGVIAVAATAGWALESAVQRGPRYLICLSRERSL